MRRATFSWTPVLNAAFVMYIVAMSAGATYYAYSAAASGKATASTTNTLPNGGPFNTPGNLLIADQFNNRVIEVDPQTNQVVWSFGSGNGSLCNPGPGSIIGPNDAERLADGLTLMAGSGIPPGSPFPPCQDNRVIIVNQQGDIVWQYGQAGVNGSGPGLLDVPVFAIQIPNKDVVIVDQGNNRVIEVNYTTRQVDWSYGPTSGPGELNSPNAVQQLPNGDFLIADQGNNRVIDVNRSGDLVWQYSTGLNTTAFASRLPNNDTLIVDSGHSRIVEISSQGSVVWQYSTGNSSSQWTAATSYPSNAVRLANGETMITDTTNDRIIIINEGGNIVYQYGETGTPGAGSDELNQPYSSYAIGDYTGQTVPPGITTDASTSSTTSSW